MTNVRVRFAPSPTGYLHVGGARTALTNWLFARHHGGVFILRIEDTDVDRSRPELVTAIVESLEWLGLKWDEGPYLQSERVKHYQAVARDLEQRGAAYPCFCTVEDLQAKRTRAEAEFRSGKYDGTCRNLPVPELERRRAAGIPFVLRFRVPGTGETSFEDKVFGRVSLENRELEDFVLLRSDGNPTYHLGAVADDLDMRITHVIRGADHISNTAKQVLMYRALDAPEPAFAHLPLILGPDRQRLSKRHGATSVEAYRDEGVLPEALVNFLALLGWTPPGGKEILALDEMVQAFEIEAVSKSNAAFDTEKLAWMNREYLRHLPTERLLPLVEAELKSAGLGREPLSADEREQFNVAVRLVQSRARNLKDFAGSFRAFFTDLFDYASEAQEKYWKDPKLPELMEILAQRLSSMEPFTSASAEEQLRTLAEEKGIKAGLLINATRVALTGQAVAPGLFEVIGALGRERVIGRLNRAAKFLKSSPVSPPSATTA
jgi:glutamyl-tRNA synthetase